MDVATGRADDAETLVFINYRSSDAASSAVFLHAELSAKFGAEAVFLDYESIPLGRDFPTVLRDRVARSAVLLAVVGERWLAGEIGTRRIDDPEDWVRKEILIALAHDVQVVPVLFGDAELDPELLPEELAVLAELQGFAVRHRRQRTDIAQLADRLARDVPRLRGCTGRQVRTVAEFQEPVTLGVHPAMEYADGVVPPYVPRQVDEFVRGALRERRHVLLVGDSTAGKSRTAYEAMRAELPDHRLLAPADAKELTAVLETLARTRTSQVLWLDDLHRYLGADNFTARSIDELSDAVVVIATIGASHHTLYTTNLEREAVLNPDHWRDLVSAMKVLELFTKVRVERRWSQQELRLAAELDDPRLRRAAGHGDRYGVAEYIAAGPQLVQKWRDGWSPGLAPRGAAMVTAAIDLFRAGMTAAVPVNVLVGLHEVYLQARGGAQLRPEEIDEALVWATTLEYGATSLLIKDAGDRYRPFDYLVDAVGRDGDAKPIPTEVWEAVLACADDSNLMSVILRASAHNQMDISLRGLARLENGEGSGGLHKVPLGKDARLALRRLMAIGQEQIFYVGLDDVTLALQRARPGTVEWDYAMWGHHREEGDLDQAEVFLRRAAEAGHPPAIADLGAMLIKQSRDDEARSWLETAVAAGIREARLNLGILHLQDGDPGPAADLMEPVADLVVDDLATDLARNLGNGGDHERARHWLRRAHDHGNTRATLYMGESHLATGDVTAAEHWLRLAWEQGNVAAAHYLGEIYFHRRDWDEAEPFLRVEAEAGRATAATLLGTLHYQRDEFDDAAHWLRKAVSAGDDAARLALGIVLVDKGELDEAESLLLDSLSMHEAEAASYLAQIQHRRGDPAEAERWGRRSLTARYDSEPALLLSAILIGQGRHDEAMEVLLPGHEAGNPAMTHNLGIASVLKGDVDAAIRFFTQAKQAGVAEASANLIAIFQGIAEDEARKQRRPWWRRRS
ncbi:tetratricopeptide repeat protein [Lentzea sp. NBC_00516]|uniref:tetratricopeptide repeat protein n=1 Tax=Lentzea sp. NBC_00516 TaxID=2903582 RepID=UPI002E814788|nr:tetratricopeptide repeat protein [Lentzea sp. NBC_00516]WUD27183.1 tetratricopeptide repeat protein [Lentzea sp. NBC_00516]